eukprot:1187569-Prorocentrum_minimum.AAC.4
MAIDHNILISEDMAEAMTPGRCPRPPKSDPLQIRIAPPPRLDAPPCAPRCAPLRASMRPPPRLRTFT